MAWVGFEIQASFRLREGVALPTRRRHDLAPWLAAVLLAFLALRPASALGQIYVSNFDTGTIGEYGLDGTVINASLISGNTQNFTLYGGNIFTLGYNTIGEYSASGTPVNTSLVTGLGYIYGIAVSGSDIFVGITNTASNPPQENDWIGKYTTSGTTVKFPLISGLQDPLSVVVSGQDLFVANSGGADQPSLTGGSVGEYTLTGAPINANLITGLASPSGLAVVGNDLYVVNSDGGSVGVYTLGATPGTIASSIPSLISGLDQPLQVAVFGPNLYVTLAPSDVIGSGWIAEYGLDGTPVNANFISGLTTPDSIVIVPEPVAEFLFAILGMAALARRRRARGVRVG